MSPRTTKQIAALRIKRTSEILDAAFHVFAEEGYHNSSVSKIAKRAKISKGLIYNYFESKEELLRSIMRNLMSEIADLYDFENKNNLTLEDVLEWIDFSMDIVKKDIKRWELYLAISFQPDVTPILMEEAHSSIQMFSLKLLDFLKSKKIDNPEAFLHHFSAVIDGVQMHYVLSPEHYPIEFSRQSLKDQILNL
jgi:AcrR family transcriptional regulator|tara:strand:+ start:822 stop:1403 length:582 start_codon:yes stop_codon:yes gene_type:complete